MTSRVRVVVLGVIVAMLGFAPTAQADDMWNKPPAAGGGGGGGTPIHSSPTTQDTIRDCTVYASGTGMGSYCSDGGSNDETLRQRFGGDKFVPCRYSTPPAWIEVPANPNPGEGRYLLKRCIEDINWDTYAGGRGMHLTISLEWVPNGADITPPENPLMTFLWRRVTGDDTALPVPMMRPEPSTVPVVGYPTFFTFAWVDPETGDPVAEGDFAGAPLGAPYREVRLSRPDGDLHMVAEATEIVIDPHQTDMKPITCTPDELVYEEGASVADQPSDCQITFTRSSATARTYADADAPELPQVYVSAYPVTVTVRWRITFGIGSPTEELGDGFEMTATQALPVQEVQAPNEPPIVLY
ncbi:hypothetical protein KV102_01205 [Mumia sp. zg.B53]|uniref:hypothetical protein n=1 Tax=Mumia sp. zg.B53 TaxID=2855449 RepID=UPI001C6E9E79|nr:hypothetical protein [Mumia sp. zg.B53]MBW9213446.1 hypothetical protein [Mumia sp. zg.B53]